MLPGLFLYVLYVKHLNVRKLQESPWGLTLYCIVFD